MIGISALAIASLSAHAGVDAIDKLKQAFAEQQAANGFAGYVGTCVDSVLYTKGGAKQVIGARQCFNYFVGRPFINDFVAVNGLVFVYRNQYMDLVLIPKGTLGNAPKGNFYYQVNYDDYGNASEATVINDALP